MLGTHRPQRAVERAECGPLRPDHRNEGWETETYWCPGGHLEQDNCSSTETWAEAPGPGSSESPLLQRAAKHQRRKSPLESEPPCTAGHSQAAQNRAAARTCGLPSACPEWHTEMGPGNWKRLPGKQSATPRRQEDTLQQVYSQDRSWKPARAFTRDISQAQ